MPRRAIRACQHLLFAGSLLLAARISTENSGAVSEALVWWPTGVAIAGLVLLGWRSVWIVATCTMLHRWSLGYDLSVWLPGGVGSTVEALLGWFLLRRLRLSVDFTRLRDVFVLLLTACAVPLTSILCSLFGRLADPTLTVPLTSGWDGWWRMNVLGALAGIPAALLWLHPANRPLARGATQRVLLLPILAAAAVAVMMFVLPAGAPSAMLLTQVLPLALFAAMRSGPLGATTTAAAIVLTISGLAMQGIGPFGAVEFAHRHVTIQIFLLAMVAVPLVLGALVAERDARARQAREAESIRAALLSVLPDATYRLHADGTVLEANVTAMPAPPTAPEFAVGQRLPDQLPPPVAAMMQAAMARALAGATTGPLEYSLTLVDGRVDRELRFVTLPSGGLLALSRDTTNRRRAERQLAWQAKVLEQIARSVHAADVFPVLVDELSTFLPQCLTSILLRRGSRLVIGHAKGLPEALRQLCDGMPIQPQAGPCGSAAATSRTTIVIDVTVDPRWPGLHAPARANSVLAIWSVPVLTPDRQVAGTLALYFDTARSPTGTELAILEQAAMLAGLAIDREQNASLLATIERNITEGLFRSVPGRGFVHANDALARMLGYASPADLLQHADDGDPAGIAHADDLLRLARPSATPPREELQLHRRDGSAFHAMVSKSIEHDDLGNVIACDATVVDITPQKQLEDQLRQAQKMDAIGQLAGGVAHDFNNLLTAITGFAEAARDQVDPASQAWRDLDEIVRATARGAALTRQLLAFGRRQVMQPRVLDLGAVVRETSGMLQRVIGEQHFLVPRLPTQRVAVRVDRSQLEQVLLNLVVNARDAMLHGGVITVDVTTNEPAPTDATPGRMREAVLTVTDTGVGMTGEVLARAFDPFFTTKEPGRGTGLGLSTVYGIVQQSGGTVGIDSSPGVGTTVRIVLPQLDCEPELEPTVPLPRPGGCACHILVVEDEPLVRNLVERALARAGHTVATASDGHAALEAVAARAGTFDLVISDVVMPRMGGRELASRLQQAWPQIPVLLMSGYADDAAGPEVPDLPLLHKPFTAQQLLDEVCRMLPRQHPGSASSPAAPDRLTDSPAVS